MNQMKSENTDNLEENQAQENCSNAGFILILQVILFEAKVEICSPK
jgi:hypothetical protein